MLIIDFYINVCDAMGANIVNTILEKITPYIEEITHCRTGIRILSNLCTSRMVYSEFTIPIEAMQYKNVDGFTVAKKIIEAYRFA